MASTSRRVAQKNRNRGSHSPERWLKVLGVIQYDPMSHRRIAMSTYASWMRSFILASSSFIWRVLSLRAHMIFPALSIMIMSYTISPPGNMPLRASCSYRSGAAVVWGDLPLHSLKNLQTFGGSCQGEACNSLLVTFPSCFCICLWFFNWHENKIAV